MVKLGASVNAVQEDARLDTSRRSNRSCGDEDVSMRFTRSRTPAYQQVLADRERQDNERSSSIVVRLANRFVRSETSLEEQPPGDRTTSILLFVLQLAFIMLFIFGSTYTKEEYSPDEYMIFRDIMAMLLIGFGYLMTFLRKYGLGAVGFTMMLTALGMQLSIFMEHFVKFMYHDGEHLPLHVDVFTIIESEFFAATLLITYGAIIGRATPRQLLLVTISESFFYAINKVMIVFGGLQAEDVGGSITIHMFGAYFGLALSHALGPQEKLTAGNADARRISDITSLIGTTVLWVFWPSFVGATETALPDNEQRCVINTIMALLGSTGATFYLSQFLGKGKFDCVHIANSTLAGGVAIGASGRLSTGPGGALLLGVLAGLVSVVGYFYITPSLERSMSLYDTCGVHNLHGLPAILGGLASAVFVTLDSDADFLVHEGPKQAWIQVAAVVSTVALAVSTGWLTGFLLTKTNSDNMFLEYDDSVWWWEGEFYEAVNCVDDYKNANKDISISTRVESKSNDENV